MNTGSERHWAAVTAVSGTVFIASGAFWLSFTSLADLARRSGIDQGEAWAWPLIVDGIIVVATVAVVALAGHRPTWYPWVLLIGGSAVSVTANALHAVVAAQATVPDVLAACVAAVPPVVLLAITHLTVVLTHRFPPDIDDAGQFAQPVEEGLTPTHDRLDIASNRQPAVTSRSPDSNESTEPVSDAAATNELIDASRKRHGVAGLANAAEVSSPSMAAGRGFVASGEYRRVRAAAWHGAGWSNKQIATELGVHPSTVGRWFARSRTNTDGAELPGVGDLTQEGST